MESDDAVAAVFAFEDLEGLAGVIVGDAEEVVAIAFANEFSENGLVIHWIVMQVQGDGLVTALAGEGVETIVTFRKECLAMKFVWFTRTDEYVFFNGFWLVDGDGHGDVLSGLSIAHMAGVGSSLGGIGDGVGTMWIAEAQRRGPRVGEVSRSPSYRDKQLGAFAVADGRGVGTGRGSHGAATDMDGDFIAAGAISLDVGGGKGEGLVLGKGNGLGAGFVGVCYHIGGFPVVSEVAGACAAVEPGSCSV